MGIVLQARGDLNAAISSYQQALRIKPDLYETYNNMGNALRDKGDLRAAMTSFIQALKVRPGYAGAYSNIGRALKNVVFTEPNVAFQELITSLLDSNNYGTPIGISKAAISLLKFDPVIKELFKKYSSGGAQRLIRELTSSLSGVPLLLKLMSICPLADLELEGVLKELRFSLLSSDPAVLNSPEVLRFQSALALQCFTNEYVYNQCDKEIKALETLEVTVNEVLLRGEQPTRQSILCLATHKALNEYEWCDLLTVTASIEEVFTRQVLEPNQETQMKSGIPVLQEIVNKVSSKVRQMYEANPYPRWVSIGCNLYPAPISKATREIKLKVFDKLVNEINAPYILIAGCGTG